MVALGFEAVALGLAIAVVWKLTRRQEACAAAAIAPARVEQGGA